jgi:hypothetical protein
MELWCGGAAYLIAGENRWKDGSTIPRWRAIWPPWNPQSLQEAPGKAAADPPWPPCALLTPPSLPLKPSSMPPLRAALRAAAAVRGR